MAQIGYAYIAVSSKAVFRSEELPDSPIWDGGGEGMREKMD
jgi:hypothetical protein